MNKAAVYVRVSTKDKQDYDRQITELTELAVAHGFQKENLEYFAEKVSGYKNKDERKEMNRLLETIKQNPKYFKMVYVLEISRIARKGKIVRQIVDELKENSVPLWIKNLGLKTLDDNGQESIATNIIVNVFAEIADEYARSFKANSISGLRTSAQKGKAGGGACLPYGYKKGENGMLVIHEEESFIIKDIFQRYLEGYGGQLIANMLNDRGVKTRFAKTHAHKVIKFKGIHKTGSQVFFSDVVIGSILKNSLYCGERNYKGEILKAPAIISKTEFMQVQEVMKGKRRESKGAQHPYLLKYVDMVCGNCGRRMFGRYKPVKGGDCIYVCSSRYTHEGTCGNTSVNIDFLENVLLQFSVNNHSFKTMAADTEESRTKLKAAIKKTSDMLSVAQKALKNKQSEITRTKQMYTEEIIGLSELKDRNEKLNRDMIGIETNIRYLTSELASDTNQLAKVNKPVDAKQLMKMKSDRTFLRRYFESEYKKLIINGASKREIFIQVQTTDMSPEFYLLLDKTALLSRYGGDYTYKMMFGGKHFNPTYKNNILLPDAEMLAEKLKAYPNVGEGILRRDEMISIKNH